MNQEEKNLSQRFTINREKISSEFSGASAIIVEDSISIIL